MNVRTCIITKKTYEKNKLLRFVVSPDLQILPDLKQKLPGRAIYITPSQQNVEKAITSNSLVRSFKAKIQKDVNIDKNMAQIVEKLLIKNAIASIALGRKAGIVIYGALACEKAIRAQIVALLLHTKGASKNGITKLEQAIYASSCSIKQFCLFEPEELDGAFGDLNVQHIAILASPLINNIITNLEKLHIYRK